MISFSKLGNYGRLGNQLFQYALLRTQAEKLHTKFYCPKWIGDTIFDLQDEKERTNEYKTNYVYSEKESGYHSDVNDIKDGTEITGFFQSDKYFSKESVLKWFLFREEVFYDLNKKYKDIDFANSTAIHIRLGDYATPQLTFYTPRKFYFKNALSILEHKKNILVFSDDPKKAQKYLKNIPCNFVFIEGNKDYEDMYLMSRCRNIICSPSSFSWWAAYLDRFDDKKIVVPEYWYVPGGKVVNSDVFVIGWVKLRAHRIFFDNYYVRYIPFKIEVYINRIKKAYKIIKNDGINSLYKYIKYFLKR